VRCQGRGQGCSSNDCFVALLHARRRGCPAGQQLVPPAAMMESDRPRMSVLGPVAGCDHCVALVAMHKRLHRRATQPVFTWPHVMFIHACSITLQAVLAKHAAAATMVALYASLLHSI
jgi:hypothetical protein